MTTKTFKIYHRNPEPIDEQETLISYDKELKEWHIFTDNPVHARKYDSLVVCSDYYRNSKTYHAKTGELIGLEGKVSGNVTVSKKRTYSDEQRKSMSDRMRERITKTD